MSSQQKYNKLANKRVLIIGGSSGIGFAVAEACIESSASVTISSSSSDRVAQKVKDLQTSYPHAKDTIRGFACDLSKPTLERDLEALFEQVGKLDHIVFTAGDPLAQMPLSEISLEKIQTAGQVRFFAPLLIAKVGSKYLDSSPQSSIIITTGSVATQPRPNWSVIASYAGGLHSMVRNLAVDLKPIRVNLVSPGAIDTELWKGMPEDKKKEMFKAIEGKVLTGKVGRPEEVAEAYLWLLKDANVTGMCATSDSGSGLA